MDVLTVSQELDPTIVESDAIPCRYAGMGVHKAHLMYMIKSTSDGDVEREKPTLVVFFVLGDWS